LCLDCVHACPHDNVGIQPTTPGTALWTDPQRSGIGRFSRRPDLAILILVLVFGAFANAAGMVRPVVAWQEQVGTGIGLTSHLAQTTAFSLLTLLLLPAVLVGGAAMLSRWCGETGRWGEVATRYAYALVPLGFAMWLAHYSFHFLTSYGTVVPVLQRAAIDAGFSYFGDPEWNCCGCGPTPGWLLRMELVFLGLGLLLSLYVAYRNARRTSEPSRAMLAAAPWALVVLFLFVLGVWIVLQPMQMRGTSIVLR
jgi:hypothetical protein